MKTARRVLLTLFAVAVAIAAVISLLYAVEDYQGARTWDQTRRQLEARGESLDAAHFIPPPVPDEQNLAMAPLFVRLYGYQIDPVTKLLTFGKNSSKADDLLGGLPYGLSKDSSVQRPSLPGSWETGRPLDLSAVQQYYRTRPDFPHAPAPQTPSDDVLLALTRYTGILDEVAGALVSRPLTRFPINWAQRPAWAISLPHENLFLTLNSTLRLRACAELTCGRTGDALRDITLGLRLSRAIAEEPFVISNLINVTCLNIQLQPIWEGLATRRWSASQLVELQTQLQAVDLLGDYQRTARGERALFVVPMLSELHGPDGFASLESANYKLTGEKTNPRWVKIIEKLAPGGQADRAIAITCQWQQTNVVDCVDAAAHRIAANRIQAGEQALKGLTPGLSTVLVKIVMPVYASVAIKDARTQTSVDEACVACALERYYLDHQSYPAALGELVPAYLPRVPSDVIDSAPLRYQQTPDGRFRLWAVGWDSRDRGGRVSWRSAAKLKVDDEHGDWVWQYEALVPSRKEP